MFRVPNAGPKTQLRRSKIKDYIPNENDETLQQWLNNWWWETSENVHGWPCVRYFSCSNIMSDSILERICDAAHHNLPTSIDNLYKETRWHLTHEYGQVIINAIREAIPAAPSLEPCPAPAPKPRRCSACKQVSHTSEHHVTLLYLHFSDYRTAERSVQCPRYMPHTAEQVGEPRRGVDTTSPGDPSNTVFHIERTSGDPGPSHQTAHYSQMRF